jgi:hypothetical protein
MLTAAIGIQFVILLRNSGWRCSLRTYALRILTFLLLYAAAVPCRGQDKVTILYDAFGESKELTEDWGFSAFVEQQWKANFVRHGE